MKRSASPASSWFASVALSSISSSRFEERSCRRPAVSRVAIRVATENAASATRWRSSRRRRRRSPRARAAGRTRRARAGAAGGPGARTPCRSAPLATAPARRRRRWRWRALGPCPQQWPQDPQHAVERAALEPAGGVARRVAAGVVRDAQLAWAHRPARPPDGPSCLAGGVPDPAHAVGEETPLDVLARRASPSSEVEARATADLVERQREPHVGEPVRACLSLGDERRAPRWSGVPVTAAPRPRWRRARRRTRAPGSCRARGPAPRASPRRTRCPPRRATAERCPHAPSRHEAVGRRVLDPDYITRRALARHAEAPIAHAQPDRPEASRDPPMRREPAHRSRRPGATPSQRNGKPVGLLTRRRGSRAAQQESAQPRDEPVTNTRCSAKHKPRQVRFDAPAISRPLPCGESSCSG